MATPGTTPDTEQLADLELAWEAFFGAVRRARGRAVHAEPDDSLTLSQYVLLLPMLDDPALSVGELAAQAAVAPPTATRALDALVGRGLVQRAPSQSDRRCVVISLTPDGERTLRRKRASVRAKRAELLGELDPQEREQARVLLLRLAELMETL